MDNNNTVNYPELMLNKKNHVLLRRWLATWIDLITLFCMLLIPDALLGNDLYQKTIIIWLVPVIMYFPLLEGLTGYTLGKFILKIKVINKFGNPPGIKKALIRTFFRLIEENPLLAGGIPAGIIVLLSKQGQRIGGMVTDTYVCSRKLS